MTKNNKIYLDYAASTPVDPQVQKVLNTFYAKYYGNSEGIHSFARQMRDQLDQARSFFAQALGAQSSEIVFTASATESNNTILKGLAARFSEKKQILISAIEHASIQKTATFLQKYGFEPILLPVNEKGQVDPQEVKKKINHQTLLVSIIWVNNEIGTIQPIAEIGQICQQQGVFFHTDAVQGFAKMVLDLNKMAIDFVTASSHKIYGPIGAGLMYVKEGRLLEPLLHGGGQENGLRSSTVNVPAIVGFKTAVQIYDAHRQQEWQKVTALRNRMVHFIEHHMDGFLINSPADGIPHILNISFEQVDGELLAIYLDRQGFALSTGSACSSGKVKGSRILEAMGVPAKFRSGTIRISLGRFTTEEEIDHFLEQLKTAVNKLRKM